MQRGEDRIVMTDRLGMGKLRRLAMAGCLTLALLSPVRMLQDHHSILQSVSSQGGAVESGNPTLYKERRLGPVLPVGQEWAGYATDFEEPGYRKLENYFLARYIALPIILKRFQPGQRLVVADMRSPEGVRAFCATWGYKVIKTGDDGAALLEKEP